MEGLVKGDVVVVPFPFSNLSDSKRRPALVVANLKGDDVILCQIRPNRIFTADKTIILYSAGALLQTKTQEVQNQLVKIFTG